MKYVQINAYSGGWADSIIFKKHRELQGQGHESYVFWARGNHEEDKYMQKIASFPEICLDALQTRIDGKAGFHSKGVTRRLLAKLDEIDPDVVHLHLLLGYYVNVEMLFNWLAAHHCTVKWTLHDCWAFTGHCIHFTYAKCMQWKTHCASDAACPQISTYPETFCSGSVKWNFEQKKRLFTMLPSDRMSLITPSKWLAGLVQQSFLSKYDVEVIRNVVNIDVFKPTPSDFRERFGLQGKFVVLGVASKWSERKGLQDFLRLADVLDSERFAVVVVGLSKGQIKKVSQHVLALPRTESAERLAEIYSSADVLVNPSAEETFGMNVAEAQACGTGVIVVEGSACAEAIKDDTSTTVPADLSTLAPTIIKLAGGGVLILVPRTDSLQALAALYSASDVLFNPTAEDNYPTVNLEAESCGTPVLTYDTGGCEETINLSSSAIVNGFSDAARSIMILSAMRRRL